MDTDARASRFSGRPHPPPVGEAYRTSSQERVRTGLLVARGEAKGRGDRRRSTFPAQLHRAVAW